MSEELRTLIARLASATPAEVFGTPAMGAAPDTEAITAAHARLARRCHPDRFLHDPAAQALAAEAHDLLNAQLSEARAQLAAGVYGTDMPVAPAVIDVTAPTTRGRVHLDRILGKGDISTVYGGTWHGPEGPQPAAIKVPDDASGNERMDAELHTLERLLRDAGTQDKHLPRVLDRLRTTAGQRGTVLALAPGLSGETLRERLPGGVPQRHAMWILRRTLSALGHAHSRGILHGNLAPEHLIIEPESHNVVLVDWCWAIHEPARTGQGFFIDNPSFGPPEAAAGLPPLPSSDLYSLARCVVALLGGQGSVVPASVDERFARLLRFMLRDSARQRPQDAWELYWEVDRLREAIWGPHTFVPFEVPTAS